MTIGKELAQFATHSVAMAAAVALCLWVLIGLLGLNRLAGADPEQKIAVPAQKPAEVEVQKLQQKAEPEKLPAGPEQRLGDLRRAALPLAPGDGGPLVTQMQGKLIDKGYSVGPAGAEGNFNDNTLTALEAFQDDNALPTEPKCDQQCWAALGLPEPP
jgi:Putative peptidoglycan binding domain